MDPNDKARPLGWRRRGAGRASVSMIEALEREREKATVIILPIGIIKETTGAGTTTRLIPPHPSADKLLTRDSETGAHARAAVRVVEIQGNVARFDILELETEPAWPEGRDPLAVGLPVYLGLPCSFEPDPEPQGREEEIQALLEKTHRQKAWEEI